MYSSRQSRYQQQIYQGINLEQGSDVASIVPLNPTQNRTQDRVRNDLMADEEAANTPMYKRVVFPEAGKGSSFLKKAQWKRFPEPVRKQMRRILNENYNLTIKHIAGATESSVYYEIDTALTQIAKHVDNGLKTHTIPGNFDTNLLNTTLPSAIVEAKEKFDVISKQVARDVIMMERKRMDMELERDEADKSKEIKEKQAILDNCSIKQDNELQPMDYTQSLLRFPSSDIFEPLSF